MGKISGIYVIADFTEAKAYVGSSVDLPRRLYSHQKLLDKNQHSNWRLQRAHNKGNELVCLPIPLNDDAAPLTIEQDVIDEFLPQGVLLNIAPNVSAPTLGRVFGPETRLKVSLAGAGRKHTESAKEKIRQGHLGKIRSEESRRKQSETKKFLQQTPPRHDNISGLQKANSDRSMSIVIDGVEYPSLKAAARARNQDPRTIKARYL